MDPSPGSIGNQFPGCNHNGSLVPRSALSAGTQNQGGEQGPSRAGRNVWGWRFAIQVGRTGGRATNTTARPGTGACVVVLPWRAVDRVYPQVFGGSGSTGPQPHIQLYPPEASTSEGVQAPESRHQAGTRAPPQRSASATAEASAAAAAAARPLPESNGAAQLRAKQHASVPQQPVDWLWTAAAQSFPASDSHDDVVLTTDWT